MIPRRIPKRLPLIERVTQASYAELFLSWITMNMIFSVVYFGLATFRPEHGPTTLALMLPFERFWNSVYFSFITATTTGYGDIVPQGLSKIPAVFQAVVAFFVFGVFVAKLLSLKQDASLRDVHRMSFESIFFSIRQGLFIVRKDFDKIIRDAEQEKRLSVRDWENLTSAYLQAQSLVEDIPDFYRGEGDYTIDRKRESCSSTPSTVRSAASTTCSICSARRRWTGARIRRASGS